MTETPKTVAFPDAGESWGFRSPTAGMRVRTRDGHEGTVVAVPKSEVMGSWRLRLDDGGEAIYALHDLAPIRAAESAAPEPAKPATPAEKRRAKAKPVLYSRFGAEAATRPFFSALTRGIEGIKQPKGAAQQWLGILEGLRGKGVKAEEIAWSGVEDWLKAQTGPVTKEQLLDYLRANEITVEEVTKGAPTDLLADERAIQERANELYNAEVDRRMEEADVPRPTAEAEYDEENEGWRPVVDGEADRWDSYDSEEEALAAAEKTADERAQDALDNYRHDIAQAVDYDGFDEQAREELSEGAEAKFQAYQLPGGENYRELLLTLPPTRGPKRVYTVEPPINPHGAP